MAAPFLHLNGQASGEMDERFSWTEKSLHPKSQTKIKNKIYYNKLQARAKLSTTDSTAIHFVVIRKGLQPETRQKKKLRFKGNHPNIPIQKHSCNIHTYILWHLYSLKNHPRIFITTNKENVSC